MSRKGLAALVSFTLFAGGVGGVIVDNWRNRDVADGELAAQISKQLPTVEREVNSGQIDSAKLRGVRSTALVTPWQFAYDLGDVPDLVPIISAQTDGQAVDPTYELIVPGADIKNPAIRSEQLALPLRIEN
jgi:hypothetical protein